MFLEGLERELILGGPGVGADVPGILGAVVGVQFLLEDFERDEMFLEGLDWELTFLEGLERELTFLEGL